MSDFTIVIEQLESENLLGEVKNTKEKLNVEFYNEFDNVLLLRSLIMDLYTKNSELEKRIKNLEKRTYVK